MSLVYNLRKSNSWIWLYQWFVSKLWKEAEQKSEIHFCIFAKTKQKKNSYFGKKRYYIVNIFACIWNLYRRYILNDQIKGRYNLCCIWEDFFLSSVGIKNVKILIRLYVSSYSMKMNRRVSYLNASPQQWKWNES